MAGDVSYISHQGMDAPAAQYNLGADSAYTNRNADYEAYLRKSNAAQKAAAKPRNFTQIDISKFSQLLASITRTTSTQKCAKSIRVALQDSGAKIEKHPVAASDWGNTLQKLGFTKIMPQFEKPKKGDIYIIKATSQHSYGHIAGYSGSDWVSDFKQRTYDVYKDKKVTYEYYRLAKDAL
ncbi:hypothetical protein ACFPT0_00540 [Acinetobacter portensis]|uniref:hypothetical protein n=1 Tax=Acinetobacter portensis TaxID=1839785 RepID=UPI001E363C2A|nr:hypothetical protein [Acinetobacter portensis]